uniref:helicase C-terminal domain-containing protein n=1 Tax=Succinivibrio sp. TaxID=2053619 RepID=UPI00402AF157
LSNSQMLTKFKEDGRSILLVRSSFWAGVDVPGTALSLVIIDKLPFDSPSEPIFKARCDLFDAKNKGKSNHFISICIPEAVIELRQGVGRLIRHEDDKGGLVICDPRLENKSFGKIFKKSLPDMRSYTLLGDFTDAVKKLIS